MAQLNDLYEKTIKDMTDDELEQKIHSLKRLRIMEPKNPSEKPKKSSGKSNKDKQILDLIGKLSPQELLNLMNETKKGVK